MYETLLGGPVPPSATPSATQNEDMSATDSLDFGETKDNDRKPVEEAPSETASALDDKQEEDEDSVPEEPSVQDTSHENDDAGSEMEVEETIENIEAEIHSQVLYNFNSVLPNFYINVFVCLFLFILFSHTRMYYLIYFIIEAANQK